jgi:Tol biopolymer transport system component
VHEATDSLYILDLSTAESRLLNRRSGSDYFGGSVAWSPDDRDIAAPVCSGNRCGFSFVDSRSGKLKLFGPQSYIGVAGVAWLPDGNHWLALLAGGNSAPQLMLVDYPGGGTRRITNDLDSYLGLSLSLDANLLVTAVHRTSLHIWTAPWSGSALGEPVQFTSGQDGISEAVGGLSWADQDKIIASTPDADGWNLQLIASGGKSQQVTQGPYFNAELTACPDGRTVVFKSDRREQLNLWKIDLPTGRTSQVTSGPSIDSSPTCSPDSKSVIFISARGGQTAIWRVALDGGSAPMRLFPLPTEDYAISRDRKWIATFDTDWWTHPPKLEIVDAGTGSVARKIALHIPGYAAGGAIRWTPDSSGVLLPWSEAGATNLWLQPVQGGRARQITHFSSGLVKDFAFSPDGRRLALSHGADTTDILLLRDFLSK